MQSIRSWRARFVSVMVLAMGLAFAQGSMAHHGWGWASDQEFELTGKITEARLGNPHGEVTLDAAGEKWTVEVGQPWRNERAGLSSDMLSPGQVMTVHGHRSSKASEQRMKAERIVIDGKSHNLYPDRAS